MGTLSAAARPRTKEFSSVGCNCNGVKGTSELEQQWCISCGVIQPTPTVPLCRGFWLPLVSPRAHCRLEWWRPSRRGRAQPALLWLLTPFGLMQDLGEMVQINRFIWYTFSDNNSQQIPTHCWRKIFFFIADEYYSGLSYYSLIIAPLFPCITNVPKSSHSTPDTAACDIL